MRDEFAAITDEAKRLAFECYPLFAGKDRTVQGAALVELVARHLAGHVIVGDTEQTERLREHLLEAFVTTIKDLIPIIVANDIQPKIKAQTH
jgi:hypothetical protein